MIKICERSHEEAKQKKELEEALEAARGRHGENGISAEYVS